MRILADVIVGDHFNFGLLICNKREIDEFGKYVLYIQGHCIVEMDCRADERGEGPKPARPPPKSAPCLPTPLQKCLVVLVILS